MKRSTRREFLRRSTAGGFSVAVAGQAVAGAGMETTSSGGPSAIAARYRDNVYTRLVGVRPHLPAHEHLTRLSGNSMPAEVVAAMAEANEFFVDMDELTLASGRRVAELLGAEAALVTCGAFSAMVLGAAACLTGTDAAKIDALPHPTWPRRECLIHRAHRFDYDRAYRAAGMTIVEAESREDLASKITDRTAMIAVLNAVEKQKEFGPPIPKKMATQHGPEVPRSEELIATGKKAGVPVLIDMASDLPPFTNLERFAKAGADLIVVSGGKGIGGPQSTGILAGRRDLIDAARIHAAPNGNIGRGMKVGKEEMIGVLAALERYLRVDHDAERRELEERAAHVLGVLAKVSGVKAEKHVPEIANNVPHVRIDWEGKRTAREVVKQLAEGDPSIAVSARGERGLMVSMWTLRGDEHKIVARRLKEVLG